MKARPIRIASMGGASVVIVPLSRHGKHEAILDIADYELLMSLGVSPNWGMCGGSVSALTPKGLMLVGRIIADAKAGQKVRYLDGDPLNLRRPNIGLTESGFSMVSNRDILAA